MGTTVEDLESKYTPVTSQHRKEMAELDAVFEEQRKAREAELNPPQKTQEELDEEARLQAEAEAKAREEDQARVAAEEDEAKRLEAEAAKGAETVPKMEFEKADQRYRTLQEKYNKEVPDLHRQNVFLYEQVQKLQGQVQELLKPKVELKPKVALRDKAKIKALSEHLAPEVVDSFVGAMEETLEEQRHDFDERVNTLKSEFSSTIGKTKEDLFWDAVLKTHKDYEIMARDPAFSEFLAEPEGLSGYSRKDFFINASQRQDAGTFIKYLDAFSESKKPDTTRKIEGNGPSPDKLKTKLGAPRPSGSPSTAPTPTKMTKEQAEAELDRIGNEFGRGKWQGRESEYDKKEAALQKIILSG